MTNLVINEMNISATTQVTEQQVGTPIRTQAAPEVTNRKTDQITDQRLIKFTKSNHSRPVALLALTSDDSLAPDNLN